MSHRSKAGLEAAEGVRTSTIHDYWICWTGTSYFVDSMSYGSSVRGAQRPLNGNLEKEIDISTKIIPRNVMRKKADLGLSKRLGE